MKIYDKHSSDEHRQIIGYRCDSCGLTSAGEDLPVDWKDEYNVHTCLECLIPCNVCEELFTPDYVKYWFRKGLCENCQ